MLDNVHFVFVPPVVVREGNDKQVNMIDVRLLYDVIPMPCQILLLTRQCMTTRSLNFAAQRVVFKSTRST